jgi:hypothetical protein
LNLLINIKIMDKEKKLMQDERTHPPAIATVFDYSGVITASLQAPPEKYLKTRFS